MEKLFENILDKNETIIKVFKPNKLKLFVKSILMAVLFCLFTLVPILFSMASGGFFYYNYIFFVGMIFLIIIDVVFTILYYNNLYYAYTNKRVIIRTGIFGVDFKSLDMGMIGAVNVYVSFLDKILRKNTGSISFGSTSSPMVNYTSMFRFSNLTTPYEIYKEIKNEIDDYKINKK